MAMGITGREHKSARCFIWGILVSAILASNCLYAEQADTMQRFFNRTPSQYKPYAVALGQRLLKAGQMRISVNGFLGYSESLDKPAQVEVVWQFPMKIRLTEAESSQSFDLVGTGLKAPADQKLADTIEVLLQDSAEGLLYLRSTIGRTRHLGSDFKLAGADAKSAAIDIVQTTYSDVFRDGKPVIKTYWFDSQTKLLGFVGYLSASGEHDDIRV